MSTNFLIICVSILILLIWIIIITIVWRFRHYIFTIWRRNFIYLTWCWLQFCRFFLLSFLITAPVPYLLLFLSLLTAIEFFFPPTDEVSCFLRTGDGDCSIPFPCIYNFNKKFLIINKLGPNVLNIVPWVLYWVHFTQTKYSSVGLPSSRVSYYHSSGEVLTMVCLIRLFPRLFSKKWEFFWHLSDSP